MFALNRPSIAADVESPPLAARIYAEQVVQLYRLAAFNNLISIFGSSIVWVLLASQANLASLNLWYSAARGSGWRFQSNSST